MTSDAVEAGIGDTANEDVIDGVSGDDAGESMAVAGILMTPD